MAFGGGLAVFSTVYLYVATRVVIAWFRNWQESHVVGYFTRFGKTLPQVAWNMLTQPALLWDAFVTQHTTMYALMLLASVGFLPLFSPGRLAVALPLFLTLCLNEVLTDPRHHAHAAAIPIIFWSAAAGLVVAARPWSELWGRGRPGNEQNEDSRPPRFSRQCWWARFACFAALVTGACFGISPLSRMFWDPYSAFYWRTLYVPGKRAEMFPRVLAQIPNLESARVASTDFVHPRFTHCLRSYDYSEYPRAVNNYQPGVPADTDYIVIDTQHPYSMIKRPNQVPEYRDHPRDWELLPDTTEGYFIVLKRIRPTQSPAAHLSGSK